MRVRAAVLIREYVLYDVCAHLQRFGAGGDLDQKRAELMKPVQDRVYNAIERVAREKNYAFVFDKSASATVLYVSEKYDISNLVLEMLGVKAGTTSETGGISSPTGGARNDKGSNSDQGAGKQQGSARKEQPRKN